MTSNINTAVLIDALIGDVPDGYDEATVRAMAANAYADAATDFASEHAVCEHGCGAAKSAAAARTCIDRADKTAMTINEDGTAEVITMAQAVKRPHHFRLSAKSAARVARKRETNMALYAADKVRGLAR